MPWFKMPQFPHYSRTQDFLLIRWKLLNAALVSVMQRSSLFVADQMLHQHSLGLFLLLLPWEALQGKGEAGGISLVLLLLFSAPRKAISKLQSHHK